jgi:hypothetical protein
MFQTNPKQLAGILRASFKQKRPVMIWGQPGIAKSQVVRQVADAAGAELICIHLSQFDSVDLRGVPSVAPLSERVSMTKWNPPEILPFEGNPNFSKDKPIYIFMDELPQAIAAVQAPAMQLVLENRLGEHKLMENVRVCAAGNLETHKSGTNRMLAPLCNRFRHVELQPHMESWEEWALDHGISIKLLAFLRLRGDLLTNFTDSKGKVTMDKSYATPRSWEAVSDTLNDPEMDSSLRYPCNIGDVGEGPASELEAFLKMYEKMPDIDKLIKNPMKADVPDEPAMLYAISAALASKAEKKTYSNIIKYVERMPPEYGVRTIKDILHRDPELTTTPEFNAYATKHSRLFVR